MARLKAFPERYERFKLKERKRYHENKNKKKPESKREIRQQRKNWRISQKKSRERKKQEKERLQNLKVNTPPNTPLNSPTHEASFAERRIRGRKQVRRDRSTLYRRVKSLEKDLEAEKRKSEKYRKRFQRLQSKEKTHQHQRKMLLD